MPSISLDTDILDDLRMCHLDPSQKLLYIELMILELLYGEDGTIFMTTDEIAWRCRINDNNLISDLYALRDAGLIKFGDDMVIEI